MCFNKELSLFAFLAGVSSSVLLLIFGNKENKNENATIALFIIWVSLMQLVDYFIWLDIDCKKGYNEKVAYLGYIFNMTQPLMVFILLCIFINFRSNIMIIVSIIYFIVVAYNFILYIKNKPKCVKATCSSKDSKLSKKHLKWSWWVSNRTSGYDSFTNVFAYMTFFFMLSITYLYQYGFTTHKYLIISMLLGTLILFVFMGNVASKVGYDVKQTFNIYHIYNATTRILDKYHVAELWCYFSAFIVMFILMIQKIIK